MLSVLTGCAQGKAIVPDAIEMEVSEQMQHGTDTVRTDGVLLRLKYDIKK